MSFFCLDYRYVRNINRLFNICYKFQLNYYNLSSSYNSKSFTSLFGIAFYQYMNLQVLIENNSKGGEATTIINKVRRGQVIGKDAMP